MCNARWYASHLRTTCAEAGNAHHVRSVQWDHGHCLMQALVKVRVCPDCAVKLNWHKEQHLKVIKKLVAKSEKRRERSKGKHRSKRPSESRSPERAASPVAGHTEGSKALSQEHSHSAKRVKHDNGSLAKMRPESSRQVPHSGNGDERNPSADAKSGQDDVGGHECSSPGHDRHTGSTAHPSGHKDAGSNVALHTGGGGSNGNVIDVANDEDADGVEALKAAVRAAKRAALRRTNSTSDPAQLSTAHAPSAARGASPEARPAADTQNDLEQLRRAARAASRARSASAAPQQQRSRSQKVAGPRRCDDGRSADVSNSVGIAARITKTADAQARDQLAKHKQQGIHEAKRDDGANVEQVGLRPGQTMQSGLDDILDDMLL